MAKMAYKSPKTENYEEKTAKKKKMSTRRKSKKMKEKMKNVY